MPGHDHAAIGYALDTGASVIVPQINTVAEAKHVMSSTKFGAVRNGTRSVPPFRLIPGLTETAADGRRDVWQNYNHQAAVMIQITTRQAIDNLDASAFLAMPRQLEAARSALAEEASK